MKRIIAVIVLMALCVSLLTAAPSLTTVTGYEPYAQEEFPRWSMLLRRGETIFFGSFPITLSLASLGYSTALALGANPISPSPAVETVSLFSIAAALSLVIAVTDYILGETAR